MTSAPVRVVVVVGAGGRHVLADLLTARHAIIEVHRNLARLLEDRDAAAAHIAEITGVRTLHLAAARRAGVPFLTYDVRQAQAARGLGFTVVGA